MPPKNPSTQPNRIWLSPPHLSGSEINYIQDAFDKNWITTAGENCDEFENNIKFFTKSQFAIALNSGTAAIHLSLILLGIKENDEVICPSFTFSATANPVLYQKAVPVFIDSEPETWNICPETTRIAILDRIKKGKKPKAMLVVHLYGQPAKMKELIHISNEFEIPIIEDAAESLGSRYENKMTGVFGKIGILSFNGNKIITTSGGGALLTDDKKIAEKALYLATQARDPFPYYQHSEIGYNYRLSNISAGIGRGQMDVLPERIAQKRNIFEFYKNAFSSIPEISFQPESENTFSNRWLTTVVFDKIIGILPEKVRLTLEKNNIESRPLWKPLHLQPVFQNFPYYGETNVAEKLFDRGLCLPSGTQLTKKDLERIVDVFKSSLTV